MTRKLPDEVGDYLQQHPDVVEIVADFWNENSALRSLVLPLVRSYIAITNCFDNGGRLFLCGNGGSFADCLHIAGEMLKSYERHRKLSTADREKFKQFQHGEKLADALEYGFPAIVLGLNHSLKSAVENDISEPYIGYAQELFALGKEDDVLLGISTSGNALNVQYAVTTAKVLGIRTIGMTGENGGELAKMVDIPLRVPAKLTNRIQEQHQIVYHTLCSMIEAHYFQEMKG